MITLSIFQLATVCAVGIATFAAGLVLLHVIDRKTRR